MIRKLALLGAAMSLVTAPLAAEQAGADVNRATAPIEGESALAGQSTLFFILGIVAVAAAVVALSEDDDDPVSV